MLASSTNISFPRSPTAAMASLSPVLSQSPNNSQSSTASREFEAVCTPACSQRRSRSRAPPSSLTRSQGGRSFRIPSSDDQGSNENAPVAIDLQDLPFSIKHDDREAEYEEELHILSFQHHLKAFKAQAAVPSQKHERWTSHRSNTASSSKLPTSTAQSQKRWNAVVSKKEEEQTEFVPQQRCFKIEASQADVQEANHLPPQPLQTERRSQIKEEISESISISDSDIKVTIPPERLDVVKPVIAKVKGQKSKRKPKLSASTSDDSISFTSDENSPAHDKKPKKKQVSRGAKSRKRNAKISPEEDAKKAKVSKAQVVKPVKAKRKRLPKVTPLDLACIPNPSLSILRSCPSCNTHVFPPKQAPPTRRRHVAVCAASNSLTVEHVTELIKVDLIRLDRVERVEQLQAEASKSTFVQVVEASGMKIHNVKEQEVWDMLGFRWDDPRRKISYLTVDQLASGWGEGSTVCPAGRKRRKLAPDQGSLLKRPSESRGQAEKNARLLLGENFEASSQAESTQIIEIDESTGDIVVETSEPTFPFPADQRLAEERFTQALLSPSPPFPTNTNHLDDFPYPSQSCSLPPTSQMPSSTFVSRSSSHLARNRPPILGAGGGLGTLFQRLKIRHEEAQRLLRVQRAEQVKARREALRLRKEREEAERLRRQKEDGERTIRRGGTVIDEEEGGEVVVEESWLDRRIREVEELDRVECSERERKSSSTNRERSNMESLDEEEVEEEEEEAEDEEREAEGEAQGLTDTSTSPARTWKPFNSYIFEHE